jgi:hypothetical protein
MLTLRTNDINENSFFQAGKVPQKVIVSAIVFFSSKPKIARLFFFVFISITTMREKIWIGMMHRG